VPQDLPVYLDHNATTPVLEEVVLAMSRSLREHFGNPSSGHVYGRRAHDAIERARVQVASLLGCAPDEVIFTSGGTEASNLAIRGTALADPSRRHVLTTAVEHPATTRPCAALAEQGYAITRLPVDGRCLVSADDARRALRDDTLLVTVMHANNETGTVLPIAEIAAAARERGALVHTDAAQSLGKVPVRVDDLGVDLLTVAGHKLYAPKGVGVLYVRRGTSLRPFVLGAGHERGLRPGTENVAGIVGLGVACAIAERDAEVEAERQRGLCDRLWALLAERIPGLALNGHPTLRLPNTLNVRVPGVRGSALLAAAPEVAASTGSACHEGGESPSAVLLAMGIGGEEALGALRLTLGRGSTAHDIGRAADAIGRAWEGLRTARSA
jgi:cysteine desulfurase